MYHFVYVTQLQNMQGNMPVQAGSECDNVVMRDNGGGSGVVWLGET